MKIIIYGSQYGTTRRYADELGKRTGVEVKKYEEIEDVNKYDTIIYFGALYAGGVMGMKKTFSKLVSVSNRKIIIATVGLADPTDDENTTTIKRGMGVRYWGLRISVVSQKWQQRLLRSS